MSTGECLNEEKYQKGRKALIRAAVLVIVAGILIGGGLIIGGIVKKNFASQIDTSVQSYPSDAYTVASSGLMSKPKEDESKS